MKKGTYLFSLVGLLLATGLVEAVSGFVLWFALPSGGGRGRLELTYLGLTRHTWIDLHDWMAIALTVIVAVHLILHWKWVVRMTRQILERLAAARRSTREDSEASRQLQPVAESIKVEGD